MRIFIDLTSLDDHLSGLERFSCELTAALIGLGRCDVTAAFKNCIHPAFLPFEGREDVHFHVVKAGGRLLATQLALPALVRRLRRESGEFDACYFPAFPTPLLLGAPRTVSAIHDLGCFDCPEAMTLRSRLFFRLLYRRAARRDAAITTVSEFSASRIKALLPAAAEKTFVVSDGLSGRFLSAAPTDAEIAGVRGRLGLPERYVLSLCTLEPRKQLPLLAEVWARLSREGAVDCPLVLAGRDGWKNERLRAAVEAAPEGSILFTGFVADGDLPALYAGAELFVFPSMYEGFGLPPLEALACGAPVLSSDAASMPEVLGGCAMYFRSGDADDLAEKLVLALGDPSLHSAKARAAGKDRARSFRWEEQAERLLECFENMTQ